MRTLRLACLASVLVAACGDDDAKVCDPAANTGCDDGLVCEAVAGADPICAKPVLLRGQVFDLADDGAVAGATVVALDANGAPVSSLATTDLGGSYQLQVPTERTAAGALVDDEVTLRVDAAGYQTFPGGLRLALPIAITAATRIEEDDAFVVDSALTDVGLIALTGAGTGAIHGTVELPADGGGVMVVAEVDGTATPVGHTAIADRDGDYRIFNVPAGSYTVRAYARGVNHTPAAAVVAEGADVEADLSIDDGLAASTLSGSVNIVNAPGGSATSVILVVESTFNEAMARGESPPGLRAPDPGIDPNVSGAFSITGVPAGRYVVLAAFENDGLVRDPDTSIAGTQIVHQPVVAGQDVTLTTSFKITEALAVIGPGADGPEAVTAAPTLTWADDSSEKGYHVDVLDALGVVVWTADLPEQTGSANVSVAYAGPLDAGMVYQFRVQSEKADGTPISATEDLRGVFYLP
jgi:hypothetical protein